VYFLKQTSKIVHELIGHPVDGYLLDHSSRTFKLKLSGLSKVDGIGI